MCQHQILPVVISRHSVSAGMTRTERDRGTVYDLMFRGDGPQDFTQLVLFRPFGPVVKVKSERVDTRNMLINIIVPLSKRADAFRRFISTFRYRPDVKVEPTFAYQNLYPHVLAFSFCT